ncbi:MAG: type II secretion system F family protein [Candidatus Aenigmarchaeota archaeon]|nr:type II secretion system F family protein [Candidatus Aenigmarchaeota archaeon]
MRIPLCPLPVNRAKAVSRRLYGIAEPLARLSPGLKVELKQADFGLDEREYMSIALFTSLFVFVVTGVSLYLATLASPKGIAASVTAAAVLSFASFVYLRNYPRLIVQRKVADIEKNLLHSLRHLSIQAKAGVPLFDALASVAASSYGTVSLEFRKAVKEINSGRNVEAVLEDLAMRNPSPHFRRSVWQLANGMKAGSDVARILNDVIQELAAEQRITIRRYGSSLNPLTLVYMMIAVIIPSLGVTFLIVLSTFSGVPVSEGTFIAIGAFLLVFQFMFLGIMKSRRPTII